MKIAKTIKTILCDNVRQEVGGKISLMGVYSKDVIVNKIPAILPIITLVLMLEDIKVVFEDIFVNILLPESDQIKFKFPAPSNIEKRKNANLVMNLAPFHISAVGKAKFEIRFSEEEEKPSAIHSFSIKLSESG